MKSKYTCIGALIAVLASAGAVAQSTPTPAQPTDPSAASSPHQRAVTKSPSTESSATTEGSNPSDASSPHQKQTVKKKKHKSTTSSPPPST
jgi:hypothetical protein